MQKLHILRHLFGKGLSVIIYSEIGHTENVSIILNEQEKEKLFLIYGDYTKYT